MSGRIWTLHSHSVLHLVNLLLPPKFTLDNHESWTTRNLRGKTREMLRMVAPFKPVTGFQMISPRSRAALPWPCNARLPRSINLLSVCSVSSSLGCVVWSSFYLDSAECLVAMYDSYFEFIRGDERSFLPQQSYQYSDASCTQV